jgi:uncharacterized protein
VRFLKKWLLLAALAAFLPLPAATAEVPEIRLYVNDYTDPSILLHTEWSDLEDLCYFIDATTSVEVAILIVNTTVPLGIDEFAVQTFNQNGVGKADLDNGVLLVVSLDEGQWRIEVGRGIEYVLNDAKVGRWGREYLEPIAVNQTWLYLFDGLYYLVDDLRLEVEENYEEGHATDPTPWKIDWTPVIAGFAVTAVVGVATKGRVILGPGMFMPRGGVRWVRGGFGGGSSGHGGARGWFKK